MKEDKNVKFKHKTKIVWDTANKTLTQFVNSLKRGLHSDYSDNNKRYQRSGRKIFIVHWKPYTISNKHGTIFADRQEY